jgi:hypothetical protein
VITGNVRCSLLSVAVLGNKDHSKSPAVESINNKKYTFEEGTELICYKDIYI